MFSKLGLTVFGMLVGAAGMYVAMTYHIVQTTERFLLVPKQRPGLTDVYVDIREWSLNTWQAHPDLANSLVRAGHIDLVKQSVTSGLLDRMFGKAPAEDGAVQ